MVVCSACRTVFPESSGQPCDSCDLLFCPQCADRFETCERCGRTFCEACAAEKIQIPSEITICNDCYAEYVEDTDFLFE
jgi:hypothetical protein